MQKKEEENNVPKFCPFCESSEIHIKKIPEPLIRINQFKGHCENCKQMFTILGYLT